MIQLATPPSPEQAERLTYQVSEIAQKLGVSHWTIRRAIEKGEIRAIRIGVRRLVPATELQRLLSPDSTAQ